MMKRINKLLGGEKGQVLPIVLGVLAVGGLTIAVSLNHATTGIRSTAIVLESTRGIYAAGAGTEYAMWSLANGEEPPAQLSENISLMTVNIISEDEGLFSLYAGELLEEAGSHFDWLNVTGNISGTPGSTANYTITVTRTTEASGNIRLIEMGAALPEGYDYVPNSAAAFQGNITQDEPDSTGQTLGGSNWIQWEWNTGQGPVISAGNATQFLKFQISGTGDLDGDYSWVQAKRQDIGIVGEITGTRYDITSTATEPASGKITAVIATSIIIVGEDIQILSWRLSK